MEHFGCRVLTKNPKLSRTNYAPITLSTRKKGFVTSESFQKYSVGKRGKYSSMDKAVSAFFRYEGNSIVEKYINELDEYRKLIYDIKADKNLAKGYYASYINLEYKSCIYSFFSIGCYEWEENNYLNEKFYYQLKKHDSLNIEENFTYKIACKFWKRFEKKLKKIKSFEEYISKSKIFCLQWGQILIEKAVNKKYIKEVEESFDEVQKKMDEISLYTIEDMLESDYLKPDWLCFNKTYHWPSSWKENLLDIPLSRMKKIVQEEHFPYHIDEVCEQLQKDALYNFDLNMAFYESLDRNKFNEEIEHFLSTHPKFVEVTDLKYYKSAIGIYIMVLDEYKRLYIGITESVKVGIKGRIQQHWNATKTLDRLIFGGINKSILSIDSFKHLDTTRIFVCTDINANDIASEEYNLIENSFSPEFIINRTIGGHHDLLEILISKKTRELL